MPLAPAPCRTQRRQRHGTVARFADGLHAASGPNCPNARVQQDHKLQHLTHIGLTARVGKGLAFNVCSSFLPHVSCVRQPPIPSHYAIHRCHECWCLSTRLVRTKHNTLQRNTCTSTRYTRGGTGACATGEPCTADWWDLMTLSRENARALQHTGGGATQSPSQAESSLVPSAPTWQREIREAITSRQQGNLGVVVREQREGRQICGSDPALAPCVLHSPLKSYRVWRSGCAMF